MARTVGDRTVFSFRDFGDRPLRWLAGKDTGPSADAAAEADDAIAALLAAMYRPETALGIRWQRGTLAVIDNTWFFHGRTAGRFSAGARRHLQRIRVTAR
jgi:alpha-ketoglutarate-dependent taurine dioxygenase